MENDLRNFDDLFREEFSGYTETPPPAIWPALEKRLDNNKKRRVFPFRWYWYFSILSFITLLGASIAWNIARVPATVALPVPAAEATAIAANDVPVPATNTTAAPITETPAQSNTTGAGEVSKSSQPAEKHTDKRSYTHRSRKHTRKTNTEANTPSDNSISTETEIVVSANAPAVGTSVYSYDDFGDDLVVEKKVNTGASDPGNENTATYTVNKTKKHRSVSADAASATQPDGDSQPGGNNESRVYAASAATTSTSKRNGKIASSKAAAKQNNSDKRLGVAAGISNPVVAKNKKHAAPKKEVVMPVAVAEKTASSEMKPVAATHTTVAKARAAATEKATASPQGADHSVASAQTIAKPVGIAKPAAKTTDKVAQHTTEKTTAVAQEPAKTKEEVHQSAAHQPLAAAAPAAAPHKVVTRTAKRMIADAGITKQVISTPAGEKHIAATSSAVANKGKGHTDVEGAMANTHKEVYSSNKINEAPKPVDRSVNNTAGKAGGIAGANAVAKNETSERHTQATRHKPAANTTIPEEDIASSATDTGNKGVAKKAHKTRVTAVAEKTEEKAKPGEENKDNTPAVAAAVKAQHKPRPARSGADPVVNGGAKTTTGKSLPTSPTVAAKTTPAAKKVSPAGPVVSGAPATTVAKQAPPAVAARSATASKANTPVKPATAIAEEPGEPAPDMVPQAKAEEPKKPAAVVKKNVTDTIASAAPTTDTTTKEEVSDVMKLVLGIKGGFETGLSRSTGNKFVVSPYLQFRINSKWSLLTQPSIKTGYLGKRVIGNPSTYYNVNPGSGKYTIVDSAITPLIGPNGLEDSFWTRNYNYTETHDSIVKTNRIGGAYVEVELPLLLQYSITPRLSVYGGLNAVYSKQFKIKESTEVIENVSATGNPFTFLHINAPAVLPGYTGITYAGNPISSYGGPAYPDQPKGLLRMGYMLGVSYEIKKRWMADILVQQCFAKKNFQGGYDINSALSMPYVRLTLGYRLTK